MLGIFLGVLTFILIIVSLFLILVVLAQKSKDAGMGAALGGGAAEAAFGAETNNVLSKSTIWAAVLFFILAFALYLGRLYERTSARAAAGEALPTMPAAVAPVPASSVPEATAPATATPAPTAPADAAPAPTVTLPAQTTPTTTPAAAEQKSP